MKARADSESATPDTDALLLPLLGAAGQSESDHLLEQLVCGYADPVIREIINYKLRVNLDRSSGSRQDAEAQDLHAEVVMRLLNRLHQLKADPTGKAIASLRGYIAVTAYNACDEFLRRKYPKRHSLKNKLRYLLTHRDGLALWEEEDNRYLCGFSRWQGFGQEGRPGPDRFSEKHRRRLQDRLGVVAADIDPTELVVAIFESTGFSMELDELVRVVADVWEIRDQPENRTIDSTDRQEPLADRPDPRLGPEEALHQRERLRLTWEEVCRLPERQRIALLLNLRDSGGLSVLALLPRVRIATIRQIAEVLGMPAERLAAFWDDLPFEDARIAELLEITRQQVINLRKSARARLARRLTDSG